jgi:hypothetical protein
MPATLAAFRHGIEDALSSLLLHGAEFDSFEVNPSSLLDIYIADNYQIQLHLLRLTRFSDWKVEGNQVTLLHAASGMGDFEEVLFALEVAHIDPNIHNNIMQTPLFEAATSDQVEIASALLESGAAPNIRSMSLNGTPLFQSIELGNFDMAHWLLFHGADTSLTNCHMDTPWSKLWERTLEDNQKLDFIRLEVLLTHLLLHSADPFQLMLNDYDNETWKECDGYNIPLWDSRLSQIKSLEYARAWSFESYLNRRSVWLELTDEEVLEYEIAERKGRPSGYIYWSQEGIVYRDGSSAPGVCLDPGTLRSLGDEDQDNDKEDDTDEDQDEASEKDWGSNSATSREYIAKAASDTEDNEFIHSRTLFYQVISTPKGRYQMATFPAVRLLTNALLLAGYRAEQDMEGDIWYEDDDGDMYYDAREYQADTNDMDGPTTDCPICKDLEKYGLGHILRDAERGRQRLFEYREKVKEKGKRWL